MECGWITWNVRVRVNKTQKMLIKVYPPMMRTLLPRDSMSIPCKKHPRHEHYGPLMLVPLGSSITNVINSSHTHACQCSNAFTGTCSNGHIWDSLSRDTGFFEQVTCIEVNLRGRRQKTRFVKRRWCSQSWKPLLHHLRTALMPFSCCVELSSTMVRTCQRRLRSLKSSQGFFAEKPSKLSFSLMISSHSWSQSRPCSCLRAEGKHMMLFGS